MKDNDPWGFICNTCGGHNLTVTHVWSILAGPVSESWQEWGPLQADHLWRYDFKAKIEKEEDKDQEVERWDLGEFVEDYSDSGPEAYEKLDTEKNRGNDVFYVNCADCDREIEFGWSQITGGGSIYPAECSDFVPGEVAPDPRYWDSWQQKGWLYAGGTPAAFRPAYNKTGAIFAEEQGQSVSMLSSKSAEN